MQTADSIIKKCRRGDSPRRPACAATGDLNPYEAPKMSEPGARRKRAKRRQRYDPCFDVFTICTRHRYQFSLWSLILLQVAVSLVVGLVTWLVNIVAGNPAPFVYTIL